MNTYHAFYNRRKVEVEGVTTLEARAKAIVLLRAPMRKPWLVAMVLVGVDGVEVRRSTVEA